MTGDTPFRLAKGRVFAALRVVPRAARPGISLGRDSAGGVYVRVQVGAAPDKGRANRAVIKALSKAWGVAPSDLEIVSGETARAKTIAVDGEPGARLRELQQWLKHMPE